MDMLPFLVTLFACLFMGLEYGMIVGVGFNLIFILYHSARPRVLIHSYSVAGIDVAIVQSHDDLKYSAAEFLKEKVIDFVRINNNTKIVLLDGSEVFSIDSTVAMVSVCQHFHFICIHFLFSRIWIC